MSEPVKPKANEETENETCEHFSISRYTEKSTEFVIRLNSDFVEISKYHKLFDVLEDAESSDLISVQLASPGGDCETLVRLVNAFRTCPAKVSMHVIGVCKSAAAILALCGDNLYVYPNTYLMFHNYSSMDYGKGKELVDSIARTERWWHEFCAKNCAPFLTKKELKDIIEDKDVTVYASDKDIKDRIERHFKKRK